MKSFLRKPGIKILCFFLCVVLLSTALLSGLGVITMLAAGTYYGSGSLSTSAIRNQMESDIITVMYDYFDPDDPEHPWSSFYAGGIYTGVGSNFRYTISDAQGNVLLTTCTDSTELTNTITNVYYLDVYNDQSEEPLEIDVDLFCWDGVYYQYSYYVDEFVPLTSVTEQVLGDTLIVSDEELANGITYDAEYYTWDGASFVHSEYPDTATEQAFTITAGLLPGLPNQDQYATMSHLYQWMEQNRFPVLGVFIATGLLGLCLLILLGFLVGRVNGQEEPILHMIFRVPVEILVFLFLMALGFLGANIVDITDIPVSSYLLVLVADCILVALGVVAGTWLILLLCAQRKNHALLSHSLVVNCWRLLKRCALWLAQKLPLVWKVMLAYGLICLVELIFLVLFSGYYTDLLVLLWLVKALILGAGLLYVALALRRLKLGAEAIAAGNYNTQVDETHLVLDLQDAAHTLNHIRDGLNTAVDSRMRSERMKTELITNVSHDLKTPLTSIVSYVDLLKQEPAGSPAAAEYLEVLDRQSQRLKKLIEDLVEASKASTGNLNLQLEPLDFGMLLGQALGEYVPRLEEAGLQLVPKLPEEPVLVQADGRRLWRVFDNLLGNAVKYAMPGTRLYLNVETGDTVTAVFRNISRDPLDVPAQELLERFVRGDASRHTEGSGLGLSIAKNLTESMGGAFALEVDADLFKVSVSFPVLQVPTPELPEATELPSQPE